MQPKYTKAYAWLLNDRYRIVQHLIFWLFFYADALTQLLDPPEIRGDWFTQFILFSGDVISVYINLYILIPLFLLKNKARLYILFSLISLIFFALINYYLIYLPGAIEYEYIISWSDITNSFIFQVSVLGSAIGLHMFKRLLRNRHKIRALETTNLKTELAFLKEQINPHFLFNALNNIYVQTRKRPTEASESILLLSDLLRYQLYDCAKEKVYLTGEIEYLKNYLRLDKLRKNKAEIEFEVKGNANSKMVAPFIFLPFVENAVKHGMSLESEAFVKIEFDIRDNIILFSIENSKSELKTRAESQTAIKNGGIGLTNVRRRLELIYPNRHELQIQNEKTSFKITLKLNI